jgi:hypothetical protein
MRIAIQMILAIIKRPTTDAASTFSMANNRPLVLTNIHINGQLAL